MINITQQHRIFIACQPVDLRKGIDGYAAVCRRLLNIDPFNGHCFIFCNRKRTAIKILLYDRNGFWLCHKRLSTGKFQHWPTHSAQAVTINPEQLNILLQ